ncbi:hypothetical protein LCGC14_0487060 [marine sediment metagenome]|uniref:HD domain-containing protein n=1 Tax=marine sediment metagenome TaxID=412755 RepID=A0A0F9SQU0_9ZZZZ
MNEMCTYTGKLIDLEDVKAEDICLVDIAHALSNICRYNGHVISFYSVAEHCVLLSKAEGMPGTPSARLLHDASEAYVGDVARPLKALLPNYRRLEDQIHKVIAEKYGVDFGPVTPGDTELLIIEARAIMPDEFFPEPVRCRLNENIIIEEWTPPVAEENFLQRAEELGIGD